MNINLRNIIAKCNFVRTKIVTLLSRKFPGIHVKHLKK